MLVARRADHSMPPSATFRLLDCPPAPPRRRGRILAYPRNACRFRQTLVVETAAPANIHLTVDEAAAELRCSRDTVTRLIHAGRLPAKDLGHGKHHNYRIRWHDLEVLNVSRPINHAHPRYPREKYRRLA